MQDEIKLKIKKPKEITFKISELTKEQLEYINALKFITKITNKADNKARNILWEDCCNSMSYAAKALIQKEINDGGH